jgi:choice-of-anchor C domain-containing protein
MEMIKKTVVMLAVALCATAPAYATTNLVTNGSFDVQVVAASPGYTTLSGGGLTGWTITSGDVDLIGSYWTAYNGPNSLDLDGANPGAISQTFTTVLNQDYLLTFEMAGNPDDAPSTKTMTVNVNINGIPETFSTVAGTNTRLNMGWKLESIPFKATSTSTSLTFTSTSGLNYGTALDAVSVVAVPESETWAMMLVGVGLVGLRLRKKDPKENQLLS